MAIVRVLADDLTGALDAAARFVPLTGPMPVFWKPPRSLVGSAAIDAETRESRPEQAQSMIRRLTSVLCEGDIAFKKLDSLLRGHPAAELVGAIRRFDHCIIAPAFPFQGRVTCGGRQIVRTSEGPRLIGFDLRQELRALGVETALCGAGDTAPAGVSLWNAESDSDLAAIVAAGRRLSGRTLWCGTAGLAGALAGHAGAAVVLELPVLALIGSDHSATVAQLSAAWAHVHRLSRASAEEVAPIALRLTHTSAVVTTVVPPAATRLTARKHIEQCFAGFLDQVEAPQTLLVSGGETLRAVCDQLGARSLDVDGEVVPGVPTSIMRGGRWDGQRVVSKSGGFGDPSLLVQLLTGSRQGGRL